MANMTFGVNLIPSVTNTYSLGNSDKKWNLYANTITGTLDGSAKILANYNPSSNALSGLFTALSDGEMMQFKIGSLTGNDTNYGNILYFHSHENNDSSGSELFIPGTTNNSMQYRIYGNEGWGNNSWRILLDSSNYSSYALPLGGGTMGGNINFSTNSYAYSSNGIKFYNSTTQQAHIGCGNNGILGFYATTKITLRPVLNSDADGVEITTSAMTPTKNTMTLGSSTNKWDTVFATTFSGNATSATTANITPTHYGITYFNDAGAFASTAAGTSGQVLKSNGSAAAPTWEDEYKVEIVYL